MSLLDLPAALRAWGLDVVEVTGWQDRRRAGTFTPMGVLVHHTAGPRGKDAPSLQVCIDGRSGLPGPLCQILIARSGKVYVIAAGRANHAGAGGPLAGLIGRNEGNAMLVGIEAENDGVGEAWPAVQLDTMVSTSAAVLDLLRRPRSHCWAHREWTPRKIDPTGIDMNRFRAAVATAQPATPVPPRGTMPPPITLPENHPGARIQRAINANGLTPPLNVDGDPGPVTADGLDAVLAYLNGVVADLSQANAASAETIKRLTAERDGVTAVLEAWKTMVKEGAETVKRLTAERDESAAEGTRLALELADEVNDRDALARRLGEAEPELSRLTAEVATLRSTIVADVVADIRAAVAKLGGEA